MPRYQQRDNSDFHSMLVRMIRAYGRRVAEGDTTDLTDLAGLAPLIEAELRAAVIAQRATGTSWSQVGEAVGGVSKQAAAKRFGGVDA